MSAEEFKAACMMLWGEDWVAGASRALIVNERNVRKFAAGEKRVGPDFEAVLLFAIGIRCASASAPIDPSPSIRVIAKALELSDR